MAHGALGDAVRASSANGFHRNGTGVTPAQRSAEWSCIKRDGSVVAFDAIKIDLALGKCFASVGLPAERCEHYQQQVTAAVVNVLAAQKNFKPDVETVQRLVIQQLWAEDLFEAAEHYQNYREERRRLREERPISPEHAARVEADQAHFPTDLQYFQFIGKFSRWIDEEKRRETWGETCDRVIGWFRRQPTIRGRVDESDWEMLRASMFNLEASPSMRVVQMAGPALDRCHMGVFNCCYHPIEDLFGLPELLYNLMQGCGNAFSCEDEYVSELPRVKKQKGRAAETIVVPDSTEGWCDSDHEALQRWFDGYDVNFDVSGVREKNTRLRTKGGLASGPEPFLDLMNFSRSVILARQGRYLEDIDVHDLACMTGKIVQVGGVRRASELSLSSLHSMAMRNAKSGNWYDRHNYRTMANNSAVYDFDGPPPIKVFMEEWLALAKSESGERGIFNRRAAQTHKPKRRKMAKFGCNPCAEIIERPYGVCNLSIAVARPWDTIESLKRKVMVATIYGIMQSTCTDFKYVRDTWKKNADEERLLGVDITGHADCPLLRYGAPGRDVLIRELAAVVKATKQVWSPRFGINDAAADTTIKPGGDSGIFFDCASGVSPRFSDFQIRWVREAVGSPVAAFLKDAGVPWAVAPEDPGLLVFGFPKAAPAGSTKRRDLTAVQQLENWLEWKQNWAEHSVSATIYVDEHEWLEAGAWVYRHFDHITGLSFLPRDNGRYTYAPNEEITAEQYDEMVARFPKLRWEKLTHYETEDMTTAATTPACVGGACEL